jgi:hypothetical protein
MSAQIDERHAPASKRTRSPTLVGGAVVRYYCIAHRPAAGDRSPVTIYRDSWAYCGSGYDGTHEWRPIQPTSHADLLTFRPTFTASTRSRRRRSPL